MTPNVSLPMYNLPEMRGDNARFWEALRELLVEAGLRDLPERLTFDRLPVPERIGPEIFFSQTCGYPLETIFSGQAIRLGTPCYAVPGCDGPTHCGLFIVPAGSAARELRDLRGGVFLFNNRHSDSGMNLPRRALADIADGRPFFAKVIETGSHPDNLERNEKPARKADQRETSRPSASRARDRSHVLDPERHERTFPWRFDRDHCGGKFAVDSPLEGARFKPSVPPKEEPNIPSAAPACPAAGAGAGRPRLRREVMGRQIASFADPGAAETGVGAK